MIKKILAIVLLGLSITYSMCTFALAIEVSKGTILEVSKETGSIFVADPAIVDFHLKTPGILYVYAKKIGHTTLVMADKDGKVLSKYEIHVTYAFSELARLIKAVVPKSDIRLMNAGDNIVIQGSVWSSAQAEDVRHLAEKFVGDPNKILTFIHVTAPTQVNLRVQVIEMSREAVRAIGINWSASFNTPATQFAVNPVLIPSDFTKTTNAVNFSGFLNRGNFTIQALIKILETNGFVTVLSEPNLTALTGQTASFLVGGEFPIPIPQGATGAVTIMFKKFGVSLAFTPTILENGKINLQVRPEVSQLSDQGSVTINNFRVPALSTRRAQTTVELNSGQSFSIAGLLQNNANKLVEQLPGLGNLPVLGGLFRSHRFQRDETELIIIVTPYIVQPGANHAISSPAGDANSDVTASFSRVSRRPNVGFILD